MRVVWRHSQKMGGVTLSEVGLMLSQIPENDVSTARLEGSEIMSLLFMLS